MDRVRLHRVGCGGRRGRVPFRVVLDQPDEYPNRTTACETISKRLGVGAESLRRWVVSSADRYRRASGVTTVESERIRKLERENRELREVDAILRDAAVFFAGELDPRRSTTPVLAPAYARQRTGHGSDSP